MSVYEAVKKALEVVGIIKSADLDIDANKWVGVRTFADKTTEQKLSSYSLGAGASYNVDVTVPAGKTGVAVTLKAAYNVAATAGVTLNVLYSPDGTNYDTDTDDSYALPFTAGATKQKTYVIAAIHPYIRLQVVNNDTSYGATIDMWVTYI